MVVDRGRDDGRNSPLIGRHKRDLGPVHRRLLAVQRLVRVGRGARLRRSARRRLVVAARVVVAGEDAADAVEQGSEAG